MAKYITTDLYDFWGKFFDDLPRKTSLEELWNIVFDNMMDDAAIEIDLKKAKIWFVLKGLEKRYEIEVPRQDIIAEDENGTKDERYNILLQLAFEKIKKDKLIKKPRKTKAKS